MVVRFVIMNAFGVGGTIRTTFTTAGALADRGHAVEVVSVYRRVDERELALDPRVRLRTLADLRPDALRDPRRRWLAGRPSRLIPPDDSRYENFNLLTDLELRRFLWSTRDGVLIATRPGLNVAVARYAHRGLVTVGQDHLSFAGYPSGLVRALGEHLGGLDAVTALTEATAQRYRTLLGPGVRTRVERLPNAAPPPSRDPAPLRAPVVAAAGTLSRRKGYERLLAAWARVTPGRPEWRLDIHGSGPGEARLGRLIDRMGLGASVRLRGHSPRLLDDLRGASIFAMTSRLEGFPMVILEAMSAGVPVVAYDCPTGPREIITDGVDGRVIGDGRTRLLADALAELMDDPVRRRAFGAAALRTAGRYHVDVIASRWEHLLTELAARR
jgi:glycosyltransferase involved in cell wall biosynthesis